MAASKISPTAILIAVKVLFGLMCLLIANFSRTLIKERLIPSQAELQVIGTVGSLFILVALLLTLVFWSGLHRVLTVSMIVTCLTLLSLTLIHLNFVKTIQVGQPARDYHYLIGYALTDEGRHRSDPDRCGALSSEEAYLECGGKDLIPAWYGTSYSVMRTTYTLLYLLFMVGVVLTIGGILRRGGHKLVERIATEQSTDGNSSSLGTPSDNAETSSVSTPPSNGEPS